MKPAHMFAAFALLAVPGLVLSTSAAAGSAAAELAPSSADPILMTGTIAPATGEVSRSLDAVAYLDPIDRRGVEPPVGSSVDLFTLPANAVRVDDNGSFTVVADPATIPSTHVDEDGLVTLRLDLTDPDTSQAGHWVASARAVRVADGSGDLAWLDPMDSSWRAAHSARSGGVTLPTVAALPAEAGALSVSQIPAAPAARVQLQVVPGLADAASLQPEDTDDDMTSMDGAVCRWGNYRTRWATVGTSYPIGPDTSTLKYGSSSNTTFGAAVKYSGGWSASGSKTMSDEWGQDFPPTKELRSYRVSVRYRQQHCTDSSGVRGHSHWLPQYETGGTATNILSSRPNFTNCVDVSDGDWWRGEVRGSDYSLSSGVKFKDVIGIDLRTQRAYSSASRLVYNLKKPRRLCGNNDDPSRASKIRARW